MPVETSQASYLRLHVREALEAVCLLRSMADAWVSGRDTRAAYEAIRRAKRSINAYRRAIIQMATDGNVAPSRHAVRIMECSKSVVEQALRTAELIYLLSGASGLGKLREAFASFASKLEKWAEAILNSSYADGGLSALMELEECVAIGGLSSEVLALELSRRLAGLYAACLDLDRAIRVSSQVPSVG